MTLPRRADDAPPRRPTLLQPLVTSVPLGMALAFALFLRLDVVQTLRVSSANMAPTLALDDHLLVRSFGGEPVRGDVVVYRSPFDAGRLHLGRVVALAGDRVELNEAGLHLDGRPLAAAAETGCSDEEAEAQACVLAAESAGDRVWYTRRAGGLAGLLFHPRDVPEGHVFVLSDNRIDPRDSRIFGAIPHAAVVGVASFVYYAFDETGIRWERISRRVS